MAIISKYDTSDDQPGDLPAWWRRLLVAVAILILCSCSAPLPLDATDQLVEELSISMSAPPDAVESQTAEPRWIAPDSAVETFISDGPVTGEVIDGAEVPINEYIGGQYVDGVCAGGPTGKCDLCVGGAFVGPGDEYLCDGGDFHSPAGVRADWTIDGLDQEDAIAHYDTLDGRVVVTPSNRVCIYAPRFAAVRRVVNIMAHEQ
ncbi:MAG: hypothetical protein WD468_00225, partial [Pirellulales bacterium]